MMWEYAYCWDRGGVRVGVRRGEVTTVAVEVAASQGVGPRVGRDKGG